jgi:protein SPT2
MFLLMELFFGVQKKRPVPTNGSGSKNVSQEKRPKVVNEVRRKVETLKDTRDYSFLFSDDAELPVPKKESLSRSGSFPNSGMLCLLKNLFRYL